MQWYNVMSEATTSCDDVITDKTRGSSQAEMIKQDNGGHVTARF